MKWIEPTINDIHTIDIIYYSDDNKYICKRVCNILNIDLFPDLNHIEYWRLDRREDEKWLKYQTEEGQCVDVAWGIFDNKIIEKMQRSRNSVLFTKFNDDIKGVMHYSDYDKEVVYRALYQNIYNFENNLRDFLTALGLRDNDLEGYYNYQINQCGDEKGFYKKQLNKLKNDIDKGEFKKYKNFQKQDFGDLILFTASSYHKIIRGVTTGFEEINAGKIAELRNIVMHARDFIGNAPDIPYNFKTFNKFFKKILEFKEAFSLLNKKRRDQNNDIKNRMNKYTLSKIEMMEDVEIFNYFMNKS